MINYSFEAEKQAKTSMLECAEVTYPTVDDHHVQRVSIEPALHGLADGADLIQGGGVQVRPTCVQCL